jgi:hypothetical protein
VYHISTTLLISAFTAFAFTQDLKAVAAAQHKMSQLELGGMTQAAPHATLDENAAQRVEQAAIQMWDEGQQDQAVHALKTVTDTLFSMHPSKVNSQPCTEKKKDRASCFILLCVRGTCYV